jgi:hypothetical protein
VPQNPTAPLVKLEPVAVRLMRAMDVQALLLDEVHNVLADTFREQRIVLNTLRYISNEFQISLVRLGVSEAREVISGDVQLARRLEEFPLMRWSADDEFEDLVLAIVRNLPLRSPTVLSAPAMRRLPQITNGIISNVFRLLRQLAIEAIKIGADKLTDDAIDQWQPMTPQIRMVDKIDVVRDLEQRSVFLECLVRPKVRRRGIWIENLILASSQRVEVVADVVIQPLPKG